MSLSLCQHQGLGSMQWNISIIEMSVTLRVSISLIEMSITPSLDVSSTPKLPHSLLHHHPSTPPPLKHPRRSGGPEKAQALAPHQGCVILCDVEALFP